MDASTEVALTTDKPIAVVGQLVRTNSFELPLLPESSSKLLRLCDEHSSPEELAQCIRNDAAIATNVLRVANSAVYSSGAPIVSVQQAVARLGIGRIREIVLVVSCKSRVFSVPGFEEEVQESFRNSLATAFFAQEIARIRRLSVEDAFLCGLLHDIGRPILLQAVFDYQRVNQVSFDRPALLDAVEYFRPEVGGSLIEAWTLPQRIADSVRAQLQVDDPTSQQMTKLLSFAIHLAHHFFAENEGDDVDTLQHPVAWQLNLYPEDVAEIIERCGKLINSMDVS